MAAAHKPEEACDLFAQAVAEARFIHDPLQLIETLMALGTMECSLQHPATAADCFREAAAVAEHHQQPIPQTEALFEVAQILDQQKRSDEASALCEQLLAIPHAAEFDAALPRARALHLLSRLQDATAAHDELALLLEAAATLYEAGGDHTHAAECKSHLAFLMGQ